MKVDSDVGDLYAEAETDRRRIGPEHRDGVHDGEQGVAVFWNVRRELNGRAPQLSIKRNVERSVIKKRGTLTHDVIDNPVDALFVDGREQIAIVSKCHGESPGRGLPASPTTSLDLKVPCSRESRS